MDGVSNTDSVKLPADILNCPICTERLTAPIIQCPNGHFVCPRCFPKLGEKCPSCRSSISTIRCLAMEKVIELALPCPKAKFECTKKLKEWNKDGYFDGDFKVWMRGESIESAVLLTTLLPHVNT
ncbi:putative E3 ubiquitin-protein ligase SINA-like 9 [Raphanus sativus]|nr:putative E3 ubiquitin-protein ligase SINA-like 9 [Raphanus sativus]